MRRDGSTLDYAIHIAAGLFATAVADGAERVLRRLETERAQAREPSQAASAAHEMANHLVRRKPMHLGGLGIPPLALHLGLGASWCLVYRQLRLRTALSPLAAGMITGVGVDLLVDEGAHPALGLTPPNGAYPSEAHLRRFAARLVYGSTMALASETLLKLARRTPRRSTVQWWW